MSGSWVHTAEIGWGAVGPSNRSGACAQANRSSSAVGSRRVRIPRNLHAYLTPRSVFSPRSWCNCSPRLVTATMKKSKTRFSLSLSGSLGAPNNGGCHSSSWSRLPPDEMDTALNSQVRQRRVTARGEPPETNGGMTVDQSFQVETNITASSSNQTRHDVGQATRVR